MASEPPLEELDGLRPERDVPGTTRILFEHVTHHIVPQDEFVHGVGLDVLGVEQDARIVRAESFEGLDHPAGAGRGGDLGGREHADQHRRVGPMQPAQGHEIHRRERDGRNDIQISEIVVLQAGREEQVGEQPGVHALCASAAVLVELDGDQRGLGATGQPRDRQRVRIRFFEVVDGAVNEELPHHVPRAVRGEFVGDTPGVVRLPAQLFEDTLRVVRRRHIRTQSVQEDAFEACPDPERTRCPLPGGIDTGEAAVMKLVENRQGELDVFTVGVGAVGRDVPHGIVHGAAEPLDDLGGNGAAGRGKRSIVDIAHPGLVSHAARIPLPRPGKTATRAARAVYIVRRRGYSAAMSEDREREPHTIDYPGETADMAERPADEMRNYVGRGLLSGRRALVTGGDSGIGRAVAIAFAKEGADVAIAYLEEHDDAEHTADLVRREGRTCHAIAGDLGDAQHCRSVVAETVEQLGGLDILVNNVGTQQPVDDFAELSDDQWRHTFAVNIDSFFHVTKAALPHLTPGGAVINTASVNGLRGNKSLIDYSATKGAVIALTYSLAQALQDRQIRVNCVAPGPVWTPLIPATMDAEKVSEFGQQAPFGRAAQPDEIAPSYVFFASETMSSYYSGEVLAPLGGETMPG